jgi:hypothetical protein
MEFLVWLEQSRFSMWIKDPDTWIGYDFYLSAHGVGMAILVGLSSAIALRILGVAPGVPLRPLDRVFPLLYAGFWINAVSGVVLLVIYPVMPVGNPVFYVKLACIAAAIVCIRRIRRHAFGTPAFRGTTPVTGPARTLAAVLLGSWLCAITAGRLMAYHGIANVELQTVMAMTIIALLALATGYAGSRTLARRVGGR